MGQTRRVSFRAHPDVSRCALRDYEHPASLAPPAVARHRHDLRFIHSNWRFILLKGVLGLVLGLFAVAAPLISTLAVEQLVGSLFIVGGFMWISRIIHRLHRRGTSWRLASSAIAMTLGVLLVRSPTQGAIMLTIAMMGLFVIKGVVTILVGLRSAPNPYKWMVVPAKGLVTLLIAYLMWQEWPTRASWAIGLFAGLIMLCVGTRLVFKVIAAHNIESVKGLDQAVRA